MNHAEFVADNFGV